MKLKIQSLKNYIKSKKDRGLEPIFFEKNTIYTDSDKLLTSRYFSNIGAFKYPRILIEEKNDSLNTSIYTVVIYWGTVFILSTKAKQEMKSPPSNEV